MIDFYFEAVRLYNEGDQLWKKINKKSVRKNSGCIEWTGSKNKEGYPKIDIKRKKLSVTRLVMCLVGEPITDDLVVCHKCDNPSCINPDHLFLGTHQDNVHDAFRKGRRKGSIGKHGTHGMYNHHRCRCEKCSEFHRRYSAEKRKSRINE